MLFYKVLRQVLRFCVELQDLRESLFLFCSKVNILQHRMSLPLMRYVVFVILSKWKMFEDDATIDYLFIIISDDQ